MCVYVVVCHIFITVFDYYVFTLPRTKIKSTNIFLMILLSFWFRKPSPASKAQTRRFCSSTRFASTSSFSTAIVKSPAPRFLQFGNFLHHCSMIYFWADPESIEVLTFSSRNSTIGILSNWVYCICPSVPKRATLRSPGHLRAIRI